MENIHASDRLIVVSADSHVSPPVTAFRPYCEEKYVARLDEFIAALDEHRLTPMGQMAVTTVKQERYLAELTEKYGSEELNADQSIRLAHMDTDGVAVEVLYHGTLNGPPIPFFSPSLIASFGQDVPAPGEATELRAAGIRAYNRWLADWVQGAPDRFIGLAHIPMWDIDATVDEIRRAYAAGLRGVNLPAPRRGFKGYNDPAWDPVWALCCELDLALHTHGGGGEFHPVEGPGTFSIMATEAFFVARRAVGQMIFGAVFERFPRLKLVLTEQQDTWVVETLRLFDSTYLSPKQDRAVPHVRDSVRRLPSEYFRSNCFIGGSFLSRFEAEEAINNDYWQNVIWGRDFPHPEGTWPFTRESMRFTFAGLPEKPVRAMLGENALSVFGLDAAKVRAVANRIGPTLDEVDEPLDEPPAGSHLSHGFRRLGSYA
jgi:predicted TIM-barrel fold metal-dependent hydrolase